CRPLRRQGADRRRKSPQHIRQLRGWNMALFDNDRDQSESLSGDAAPRGLSFTVVENDFVARVYEKLASSYDLIFGPTLHPGRLEAIDRMTIQHGDAILE